MAVNQWTLEPGVKSAHPTRTRMSFASAPPLPPPSPTPSSYFCPAHYCCCCCCQAESYAIFAYYFHNQYSIWAENTWQPSKRWNELQRILWHSGLWAVESDGQHSGRATYANTRQQTSLLFHFKHWLSLIDLQPLCPANFPSGNTKQTSVRGSAASGL